MSQVVFNSNALKYGSLNTKNDTRVADRPQNQNPFLAFIRSIGIACFLILHFFASLSLVLVGLASAIFAPMLVLFSSLFVIGLVLHSINLVFAGLGH